MYVALVKLRVKLTRDEALVYLARPQRKSKSKSRPITVALMCYVASLLSLFSSYVCVYFGQFASQKPFFVTL